MTARVSLMMRPTSRKSATQQGLVASLAVHAALLLMLPLLMRHGIVPAPPEALSEITVLPPRHLRPKPAAPAAAPAPAPVAAPKPAAAASPAPVAPPKPMTAAAPQPVVAPPRNTGSAGRERARHEVAQQVASVAGSVNQVLADLSTSLASTDNIPAASSSQAGGRRRAVRAGRSDGQLGAVSGGVSTAGAGAGEAGLGTALIAIEAVTQVGGTGLGGSGTGGVGGAGAAGSPDGEVGGTGSGASAGGRSNASLLAVVRRYAPGIQFCYDNELKRNSSLRGKIVLGLVVAATGEVVDVQIVEDTLGAAAMRDCVLAQVRAWRFPAVAGGNVGFRTPFVFTPPR